MKKISWKKMYCKSQPNIYTVDQIDLGSAIYLFGLHCCFALACCCNIPLAQ